MVEGFGSRLREFRLKKGMTQPEFAAALGVAKQSIANIESGQQGVSLEVLQLLHAQGADLNWLIAGGVLPSTVAAPKVS